MSRKNNVMLILILTAVLLVSVVQTTFSYFAATVSTTGTAQSTVTAATVTSATMALGDAVNGTGVYPGFKALRTLTLTGSGGAGAKSINTTLRLTPSVANFGTHVKYTVYKIATSEVATKKVTCTTSSVSGNVIGSEVRYTDGMTCDVSNAGKAVKEGVFSETTPVDVDITVTGTTADTYYVVIEYVNDPASNQATTEAGKSFTVTLSYIPKA